MMRKRILTTSVTVTAAAAMTLALASSASADLTTRCVGEGGAVTVPGDLVVPNGKTCVLTGTVVQGDVRVGNNADLIAEDATFEGDVRVRTNAYFEAFQTDVSGRVVLVGSFGTFLTSSSVGDDIRARTTADVDYAGFVFADDVDASARVIVDAGELLVDQSVVVGDVIARDSLYADIYDSFVDGRVRSVRNEQGSVVCSSAIQGDARFIGNPGAVQLGGDGPLVDCDGSSYWASDVRVANNTGGVYLDDNIVNADVTLVNNDPVAQLGDGNMVRGDVNGDFEAMVPAAALKRAAIAAAPSAEQVEKVEARADVLDVKIDARRSGALKEAAAAGDAF